MQAVLNISQSEIDSSFLDVVKSLFSKKNIDEIVIKKTGFEFEEFDSSVSIDTVLSELKKAGQPSSFLNEIKDGLKASTAYKK